MAFDVLYMTTDINITNIQRINTYRLVISNKYVCVYIYICPLYIQTRAKLVVINNNIPLINSPQIWKTVVKSTS